MAEETQDALPRAGEFTNTASTSRVRDIAGLIVMAGANVFNVLTLTVPSPIMALIGAHFATHPGSAAIAKMIGGGEGGTLVAQLMITLLGIGIIFGGPFAGWLTERLGSKFVLTAALGVYALTGAAGLWVEEPVSFLGARFMQGVATGAISTAVMVMIAQRFEGAARARFMGLQSVVLSVSAFLSIIAAGGLAEWGGWRVPFALYLTSVPMLILALLMAQTAAPGAVQATAAPTSGSSELWKHWPFYLMMIPFSAASNMTALHLSFVLAGDGITQPNTQGLIMSASMVFNVIGSVYYARLFARIGRRMVFVTILAVFGAGFLLIGVPNVIGSIAGCWVIGIAGGLMTPFFVNAILDLTPPHVHGRAVGLQYTMLYIGTFLNPIVITPLRSAVGDHPTFAIVGGAMALAAVLQAMTKRSPVGGD